MKKILISTAITVMCAGVCVAATYKIKSTNSGTVVKSPTQTTTTQNYYNNYNASPYVNNNTVNSSYAGIVEIVMDFSGSMSDAVAVAKSTMSSVVSQISPSIQVGFRVFGQGGSSPNIAQVQNVKKTQTSEGKTVYKLQTGSHKETTGTGCKATKLVTPIASANSNALITGMNSVSLGGSTPIVLALQEAVNTDLSKYSRNIPKKIVLITDGYENCGGDPCAFARTLMATRRDIQIDVVLVSPWSKGLNCLAALTGGNMYNLSNARELTNTLTQIIQTPVHSSSPTMQNNTNEQQYEFIPE